MAQRKDYLDQVTVWNSVNGIRTTVFPPDGRTSLDFEGVDNYKFPVTEDLGQGRVRRFYIEIDHLLGAKFISEDYIVGGKDGLCFIQGSSRVLAECTLGNFNDAIEGYSIRFAHKD